MHKQQMKTIETQSESELTPQITLENIIDHSPRRGKQTKISGAIATLLKYDSAIGQYFICNPYDPNELIFVHKSIVEINESAIDKEVLVVFEEDDIHRPVITGIVQSLTKPSHNDMEQKSNAEIYQSKIDDSERLVFNAEREIVLQCGKSSIHLTKAGKIIIRGSYVLSRSTGLNSLKGGSVSIN